MAQRVRRKLTTVMSADVDGYSRLMDIDEVDTLRRLKTYREAMFGFIERHRGRVVNTAGDSVLAEFDSVVEAVQCAAEIQRELDAKNAGLDDRKQMRFRIGLNLGDVMVEGNDLFGEGVNIAARLQGLAEPGGILISGTVFDQVRSKLTLDYDFVGEQAVKNIAEEIPIYRVLLDPADIRAGGYMSRKLASPVSPATSRNHAIEGNTARRVYMLFVLSLVFGVCGLIAGAFTEGNVFGGPGGKIEGDAAFTEDGTFSGAIGGNVVVTPGVKITLGGKIDGNLILGPKAVAEINGKIEGDVINYGGVLRLRGKLAGSERHQPPDAYAGPASTQSKEPSTVGSREARSGDKGTPALAAGKLWIYLASVLGALCALTLVAGVIISYVNRGDGTSWVDTHYQFQIRTFWIGALAALAGGITSIIIVGLIVLILLPFWLLIRCIRGWKFLGQGVPHPSPRSWLTG